MGQLKAVILKGLLIELRRIEMLQRIANALNVDLLLIELCDQNDINEDTRMQLELINQTLAELQVKSKKIDSSQKIGFKLPEDK